MKSHEINKTASRLIHAAPAPPPPKALKRQDKDATKRFFFKNVQIQSPAAKACYSRDHLSLSANYE